MKKVLNGILRGALFVLTILLVFPALCLAGLVYLFEFRATDVDTSLSPDQEYSLTLKAVGEPLFFDSAPGRLILQHQGKTVSSVNFKIADDGGSITPDKWKVTWNPDCVSVILSGSEQMDHQIQMYYNGEIKQSLLLTRFGEPYRTGRTGESPTPETDEASGVFTDEPEIRDGYLAVHEYLTGNKQDEAAIQYGAKATESRLIVSEDSETVKCLVYDRKSANGKCCLYACYLCPREADGSWSYQDAEILDILAYAYESGEVVSSGKTDWGENGTPSYQEITGEP